MASAGLTRGSGTSSTAAGPVSHTERVEGCSISSPGCEIVGTEAPPFTSIEGWPVDELRRELQRTKPHILWVGLGAPKQELWMGAMSEVLDVPVMVGVGAAFDYLAGTKQAAPRSLRHLGLEWLFRLAVEPKRLWRRYLVGNSTFLYLVLRDELSRRVRRDGA